MFDIMSDGKDKCSKTALVFERAIRGRRLFATSKELLTLYAFVSSCACMW